MKLVDALPNDRSANAIGNQLVRSSTSVGANYRAACRARSKKEFIAKLGIVEEEADESCYWIELIIEGGLFNPQQLAPLLDEAQQITAIIAASRITAIKAENNLKSQIQNRKSNA